jgi:hypothetical protein
MYLLGNTYTLLFQNMRRCVCMLPSKRTLNLIKSEEITRKMQNTKIIMIKSESALKFFHALSTEASSI